MPSSRTALVIAGFDSQLKWASGIAAALSQSGYRVEAVAPASWYAFSDRQISDVGFDRVTPLDWNDLIEAAANVDVVVCALSGPYVRRVTMDLAMHKAGPVVIAGWVGIIIEKRTAGYLDRCGADVVAVNSSSDLAAFEHTARLLELPADNLILTGLPVISSTPEKQSSDPIRTVVFADQPTLPGKREEREYLYERLIRYARRHPDRQVLLKPRHMPGEGTIHRMIHSPESLIGDDLPANFRLDYTPIPTLLETCDLLLTVSSTACLEALDAGVRVGLILDLGVQERLGNHVLIDSGLLRTFDQLESDDIGTPNPDWFSRFATGSEVPPAEAIARRADELVTSGERPGRAAQSSAYFAARRSVEYELYPTFGTRHSHLERRRSEHGYAIGTLVHLSHLWLPPIVGRPLRIGARKLFGRSFA